MIQISEYLVRDSDRKTEGIDNAHNKEYDHNSGTKSHMSHVYLRQRIAVQ